MTSACGIRAIDLGLTIRRVENPLQLHGMRGQYLARPGTLLASSPYAISAQDSRKVAIITLEVTPCRALRDILLRTGVMDPSDTQGLRLNYGLALGMDPLESMCDLLCWLTPGASGQNLSLPIDFSNTGFVA